ncbi:MAG: 30S ribosomal protein S18 [Bacteroidota bacterium]|nr:30S ribosomal protein S18 [Candidatus Kapabacteria bacterium]MCS7302984.1 30S ribosomal protein S18 [Candidatus Kapabacteria bacterium]MCX7937572.1 30S ribosomal protein S18 [Chlorobiota bacterium]MDW8075898.1 30S ribosomal protein S18 [Bacteroidota bacterium]MDW8272516.1 30S ribosomal protein S18 [Bacteroidota bacterium]
MKRRRNQTDAESNGEGMSAIVSPFRGRQTTIRKRKSVLGDAKVVDYLDPKFLQQFINDQGKILPRRVTGLTAYQQRQVARAIKYARHLALLPFVASDLK